MSDFPLTQYLANHPEIVRQVEESSTRLLAEIAVTSPEFSEDALALQFVKDNEHALRFTAELGKYYRWTSTAQGGGTWQRDNVLGVFDRIRQLCRESAMLTEKESLRQRLCSASMVANVEHLTRSDPRIAITTDKWDADVMQLNTPAGIIDLETGRTLAADPQRYHTKSTAVAPALDVPKLWEQCLRTWTDGDLELQQYLKRVCGYCLTGETREHQFFFLHGSGRNGKSVFLNTISGIVDGYARICPSEVFTAPKSGEKHPTASASLVGCRLALATETEANSRWAEAQLKALVAGDRMSTRFMRQDFFEFQPRFKLLVSGNHRPNLSNVDEAMRSRLNLLPFEVIIPSEQRDTKLSAKLRNEWGAILNWMIEGCLEWQRDGLKPPACVRLATDDYLQDQDLIGQWITECCVTGPRFQSKGKALYSSWKQWSEEREQFVTSQKSFIGTLKERPNIRHQHTESGNHFVGIGLRADMPERGY